MEILHQEEVLPIPQGQKVNLLEVPLQQEEVLTVAPLLEVQIILQDQQEAVQQEAVHLLEAVHLRQEVLHLQVK